MIKINGVTVKTPSEFSVDISDIDGETTRNAKGSLIRDRIAVKRKLNLKFPPMSTSDISTLLNAVSDVFFTVEYLDPYIGSRVTKTMYVGDRSTPMYRHGNGTTDVIWESLSMNLVER